MPLNSTILFKANEGPKQLTLTTVTSARIQNVGGEAIFISATINATAPATADGSIRLLEGEGISADVALSNYFPGVGAGPFHLWAWLVQPTNNANPISGKVSISYA